VVEAVVIVLIVAVGLLWQRLHRLERRLARIEERPRAEAVAKAHEPVVAAKLQVATPVVASDPEPKAARVGWGPGFNFEDLFGRLLPIWAGGVTLAVAGFFLVRWSIDAGLLTPSVRVVLAFAFGLGLLAGAEAAYRWRERVADPRVAQALAGAGLATLYAAFYLAGSAYGLIAPTIAFVGLAAVTAGAIALSYRFGLPSAVLGLVGGFAAPALVGGEQANVPLLTLYLALVTAGLTLTGRRQGRAWLGLAALAGGLGWGALLIASGAPRTIDGAVLGAYLVLLGAIVPALSGETARTHAIVRVAAAGLAALQLAVLVQQSGFDGLEWSLYLLLGAALAWFDWRQAAMREANALAAAVGVALLFVWPSPDPVAFAVICAGLAAIFAGVPLAQLWRGHGRALDVAQASAVGLGLALAALRQFGAVLPDRPQAAMAAALFALGLLPAGAVGLARHSRVAARGAWLEMAQASAALLAYAALAQVLPENMLAWTAAIVAALLAWRARQFGAAAAMLAVLATLWALQPVFAWLEGGALAVMGTPMIAAVLPGVRAVALDLLPAVAGLAAWSIAAWPVPRSRTAIGGVAVALAGIAGHIVFRHAFAAIAGSDFVSTGVLERAAWEAVLLAVAWLAAVRGWRLVAIALAAAALGHFAWFAMLLHNPLWSQQAVGPLPLANALMPLYAVGVAALLVLRRLLFERPVVRWALDGAVMLAITLFALSELRQSFAGSLLQATPVGPSEDLLRSLLGIVLAGAFLLWGARRGERSWRIGSLVLMLVAVLKVFLLDAAGLAGLARIASFMALGFSLIAIGWFYARQLGVSRTARAEA
jgi:uncharacterized membrane protein